MIVDADVASMYPNIAIANRVYPEHLSEKFCDIYQDVYNQRKSYPKGSAENAMLKLALNGVYGDSNNKYSPFYDPQYTMSITINGQLSLCLLADKLMDIEGLSIVQVNTDGITVKLPRSKRDQYDRVCDAWQKQVGLQLEYAEYSKMIVRDCNNYLAIYTDGKVKRKGAYQYEDLGWHQDQGGLVIPKAAEAAMLQGIPLDVYIKGHKNKYDFMLRAKVPRSSKLVMVMGDGTEVIQQNTCRYYACNAGGNLVKVMPPLKEEAEPRRIGIGEGYSMWICNDINDFTWKDVDYQYYIDAAEKLVIQ
jgi:DNA polymerase elongation subunit (family B)